MEHFNNEMDQKILNRILDLVHTFTGITMNASKKTLLQGRLRPRIKELKLKSYDEYLDYLRDNKNEVEQFVNLITTNETSFFRTQKVWDFFLNDFLPEWESENKKKTLKIWSAASSSGEEAHTIGICCEEFKFKNPTFNYQIIGTDISTDVLSIAEKGIYKKRSIDNFRTNNRTLFDKYIRTIGEEYLVSDSVRSRLKFFIHNLFSSYQQSNYFDIVFLRNVLIYFESVDQEAVVENASKALIKNGLLIIGESESLSSLKTKFIFKSPLIYENKKE